MRAVRSLDMRGEARRAMRTRASAQSPTQPGSPCLHLPKLPIMAQSPWVRWVVERTIGWLKGLRRLRVGYDRLGVIMDAWATLASSVICFRILHHDVI